MLVVTSGKLTEYTRIHK